jgi:hypothetical protein
MTVSIFHFVTIFAGFHFHTSPLHIIIPQQGYDLATPIMKKGKQFLANSFAKTTLNAKS